MSTLDDVFGALVIAISLLGLFLLRDRPARAFMLAVWVAYIFYGLYFDYHIWSHDYYNLPLIPLAALSLGSVADTLAISMLPVITGSRLKLAAVLVILAFALFVVLWQTRTILKSVDYRPEARMWAAIGSELGPQARVVALTQDYGSRLAYWGWLDATPWPVAGDISYHGDLLGAQQDFDDRFKELAQKRDFFLVTLPGELKLQPLLMDRLAAYPIYVQGDGYVVYDLRR